uniref:FUN14 domain containing 1 n=1 Tax=Gopherus evgoodei TaxID=1825980 RepID=A0A8C4VFF4_9SAUR
PAPLFAEPSAPASGSAERSGGIIERGVWRYRAAGGRSRSTPAPPSKQSLTWRLGGLAPRRIASHSGYVQVDWKRVEKDVNKAKRQIKKRANRAAPEISTLIEESTEFIKQNIVVSSGFVGGFLLGLAS